MYAGLALGTALGVLVAGCAKRPTTPPASDGSQAAAHRAYRTLIDDLGVDSSVLRDRVIVLDPGHGGGYRGAMGREGTAEADVNLAVALFLWGLLTDAGAQVHLTRTVDRDLVGGAPHPPAIRPLPNEPPLEPAMDDPPPAPSDSLPAELSARVQRANALAPDLFLSVHHNADAGGDTTRNQTLTFYRLGDSGPSLDAARSIHRYLMRNLGTAAGEVRPGNYHVLRNSSAVAAVLGEPSFLTNPVFEAKLARIDRVELEATAYFLGIADYFGRGVARTLLAAPRGSAPLGPAVELAARFIGSPIDPGSVEIHLDGKPLAVTRIPAVQGEQQGSSAYVASAPAAQVPNGWHRATTRARCLGGNAAAPGELRFEIRRPPAEIYAEAWPPWDGGARSGTLGLAVEVRDRFGHPVADSTVVLLQEPMADSARTRAGRAWFVLGPEARAPKSWRVRVGDLEARVPAVRAGAPRALTGIVRTAGTGQPVLGAELRAGPGGSLLGYTNPDGRFAVTEPAEPVQVAARGHLPAAASRNQPELSLAPVLGGVLFDLGVAIDPAGGGADPLAVSATGIRAADATLEAARALQSELARAGARPILLRTDDRTLSDLARVEAAEAEAPALYIRFGAAASPRIRHYPGSKRGGRLAALAAAEIAAELGLDFPVAEEVTPILQLTSVPALEVLLPTPTDPAREDQLLDPRLPRQLGRALALALAAEGGLALPSQGTARLRTTSPAVLIDGRIATPASQGGPILLRALEPAPAWHEVAPLDPGGEAANPTHFSVPPADTVDLRL